MKPTKIAKLTPLHEKDIEDQRNETSAALVSVLSRTKPDEHATISNGLRKGIEYDVSG